MGKSPKTYGIVTDYLQKEVAFPGEKDYNLLYIRNFN